MCRRNTDLFDYRPATVRFHDPLDKQEEGMGLVVDGGAQHMRSARLWGRWTAALAGHAL